jgi:hypothetical protein
VPSTAAAIQFDGKPVVVDMLLHASGNAYIYCTMLVHAVLASSHDQGSTLGAVAALTGIPLPRAATS